MGAIEKQVAVTLVALLVMGVLGFGYVFAEPALRQTRGEQMIEESAHRGQTLFAAQNCAQCHLENGYGQLQGGAGWPLNTTQNQRGNETEMEARRQLLYRTLERGRGPVMAAYHRNEGGPLNTEQINGLVAYIQHGDWPAAPVEGEAAKLVQAGGAAGGSQGAQLFQTNCAACHQLNNQNGLGPGLGGIGTTAATRKPGTSAEDYIRESIVQPNAYIVQGFQPNVMPQNFGQILKPEEIDALVAYLMEQK